MCSVQGHSISVTSTVGTKGGAHIGEAASRLGVTPRYLRMLEAGGKIPPARRDLNGRVYSPADILLLKAMGVGSRPRHLLSAEEALEDSRG